VSTPEETVVILEHVLDHTDHICQLAGNADHVGIGSDLDGGFGTEQTAQDINSIADLAKLEDLLEKRGCSAEDREKILHGNFVRFLREHLPA
jgi:membrane dipeptidase